MKVTSVELLVDRASRSRPRLYALASDAPDSDAVWLGVAWDTPGMDPFVRFEVELHGLGPRATALVKRLEWWVYDRPRSSPPMHRWGWKR